MDIEVIDFCLLRPRVEFGFADFQKLDKFEEPDRLSSELSADMYTSDVA